MQENKNIVKKIRKLLNIANDPNASDNEIMIATKQANKLMIRHKINFKELSGKDTNNQKVTKIIFDNNGKGYPGYIYWALDELSKFNRCKVFYLGRINANNCRFNIYGLESDLDLLKPMCEALIHYLCMKLKDIKSEDISMDFRVYKKSYLLGFANELNKNLKAGLLEEKETMSISDEKFELMVTSIPAEVDAYVQQSVKPITVRTTKSTIDRDAYNHGATDANRYDVSKNNLIC